MVPGDTGTSRRAVLSTGAAGVGLSGCLGGKETDETTAPSETVSASTGGPGEEPVEQRESGTFGDLSAESINGRIEVTTDDDLVAKFAQVESGDTLVLSSGTHEIDEPLRGTVNDVTIRGQGANSTIVAQTTDAPVLELHGEGTWGEDRLSHWNLYDLALYSGGGEADVLHTEHLSQLRARNLKIGAWETTGNGIYAKEGWDWALYRCRFAAAGDPERGTADVYVENSAHPENTNNFHFTDCHWERIQSYAFYSDISNNDDPNRKQNWGFRFAGCKFHGQVGRDSYPDLPFVGGEMGSIQIVNTVMGPGHRSGHVVIDGQIPPLGRGGHLITNNLFAIFERGDGPSIEVRDNRAAISNNYFYSRPTENPAVRVTGGEAIVANNHVGSGGLEALEGTATFEGNTIVDAPGEDVTVETDGAVVTDNVLDSERGAGDAIHVADAEDCVLACNRIVGGGIRTSGSADYNAVLGNVVRGGSVDQAGENGDAGINVTR